MRIDLAPTKLEQRGPLTAIVDRGSSDTNPSSSVNQDGTTTSALKANAASSAQSMSQSARSIMLWSHAASSTFRNVDRRSNSRIAAFVGIIVLISTSSFAPRAFANEPISTSKHDALIATAQSEYDRAVAMQAPNSRAARKAWRNALEKFEVVLDDGVRNAGLLFNAGNAAYRLGQYAKAIVYYRRALLLEPNAADVQQNLEQARRQVKLKIAAPPTRAIWAYVSKYDRWLAPAVWRYVAYASYVLFWVFITLRWMGTKSRFQPPMALLAICLVVALIAGPAFYMAVQRMRLPAAGVVLQDQTELLKGNGAGYQPRIDQPLSAGVEFQLIEQRPDPDEQLWYRIRLADDTDGWIRAERALLI